MTIKKDFFEIMEKQFGRLTVGKALKAWRLAEGLSQGPFAKRLGISVQSLCDLEKGRRVPTPARAAKMARKMGIPEISLIQLALRDALFAEGFEFNVRLEKVS
ncbi:MAG: helix-turn-helix transcriptional regulator [Bdellovibrionaceae bacterium]|nr:helix-turn-helix transcriptional regulator [Pseudobdellovibrionaceae bacterium]MBX3034734.1 helix-turn-helix transcriptional regulator [Pseudobdellovibrionaceae bacterium]